MCHGVCPSDVTGLACGASDVTGLACVMASVRQMSQVGMWCVRCNRFGMCHGVCASDVTGLAFGASDVTGLACVMASVRQMSQVWHVSWRLSVRCHRFGMWCVRCNGFGMCHGVCASDVTGLACVMASVRQMSQVWHVVRQM